MQADGPPVVVAAPVVDPPIAWRHSRAVGKPYAGRLVDGVQLPAAGRDFWTYDWGTRLSPNRPWRRWGTDRLVATLLRVLGEYRAANPAAPRVGVADLSRPHGGHFGEEFGGLGHASHQNGLDADILYPRKDDTEQRAVKPSQVDRKLAQELVDRFVRAGARTILVGPSLKLRGRGVQPWPHHDDHLHLRLSAQPGQGGA